MPQQDQWLDAICDAPDDDAPRLDYAKWLTQQGDPRGEFIRTQCEIAALSVEDSRYWELDGQLRALLNDHEQTWLGALWGRLSDWTFTRGFLTSVSIDGSCYLPTSDGRALYRSPLGPRDLMKLLAMVPPTLATLALRGNKLGAQGAQALVDAQHLKLLRAVDVAGFQPNCKPTDWEPYEENVGLEGVKILTESRWSSRLHELNLSLNRVDDQVAAVIATSPNLNNLRSLTLHESNAEPYCACSPWFSDATVESLRASFGHRLSLSWDCPRNSGRQDRRRPFQ